MYYTFRKYKFNKGDLYKYIGKNGINMKTIINNFKNINIFIKKIHLKSNGFLVVGKNKNDVNMCIDFLFDFFQTQGFLRVHIDNDKIRQVIGYNGVKFLTDYIYNNFGIKCYLHFQNNGVLIKSDNGTKLIIIANFIYNYLALII